MRQRLDDARSKARMWDLAARFPASQSIVGDREAPARILRVVADQDFALRSGREAMLQAVDHELRHDQPEAHRFAGYRSARGRLHLDRERPAFADHRCCKTGAQLREIGPDLDPFVGCLYNVDAIKAIRTAA